MTDMGPLLNDSLSVCGVEIYSKKPVLFGEYSVATEQADKFERKVTCHHWTKSARNDLID